MDLTSDQSKLLTKFIQDWFKDKRLELETTFGIGGVVTFKKSGLDAVVKQLSLDEIVLETDSPYLAPTPHRGKRNESAYLPLIADKLSDVFEISEKEIARITTENAVRLFGL